MMRDVEDRVKRAGLGVLLLAMGTVAQHPWPGCGMVSKLLSVCQAAPAEKEG